jgi:S-adenosylmethionine:tRNA ribosyltransferase-isomerase
METHTKNLQIKDFDYHLPEDRIAKYPLQERDASKLLVYKQGNISETVFKELHQIIPPQSVLVFNDTKVIHARLLFQRASGANIEIFCIEPIDHLDYQLAFASKNNCSWKCMVGNAKRWKGEPLLKQVQTANGICILTVELVERADDYFTIRFSWDQPDLFFGEVLHLAGLLPLPPYLNRDTEMSDEERYQTIYASREGSVAAPTAGLHFTDRVFENLKNEGVEQVAVTLHVGAGTFKPVKSDNMEGHEMHEEVIEITDSAIDGLINALTNNKPIVVVGTTSLRTIESLYWHGVMRLLEETNTDNINIPQWYPYEIRKDQPSALEAMLAVRKQMTELNTTVLRGTTKIIIAPGYSLRMADALITNFHQPGNTLMLLVAAVVGNDWKKIYDYALANNFRFLSYGDSSILFR